MADQITYPNKVTGDEFLATEATEIKTVVNTNATELTTATADIAINTAQFSDLDEEAVRSALVEASINTSYELDLAVSRMWLLALTADTTISISNLAASKSVAYTVKLTGAFVPTLSNCNVYGDDYDGSIENLLTFNTYRTAGDVQVNDVIITNLA